MVSAPKLTSESKSALRRPKLSEYQPVVMLLKPMPSNVAEASMPAWPMDSPKSCWITGKAMVSRMISIASNR